MTKREIIARLTNLQRRYDAGAHRSDCADLGLRISDLIRDLSAPPTLPEGWVDDSGKAVQAINTKQGDGRIECDGDDITCFVTDMMRKWEETDRVPVDAARYLLELSEGK